ncbi:MAG: hypothetical protein JST58_00020 [Bacteroidetes bacterium]|nr:hypothetical protein [Bacteroidota bacterium]
MKKLKLIVLAFAGISLIMVSCSKNSSNSSTPKITDSVFYSNWMTISMTNQGPIDTLGDSSFYQSITASKLTSAILNKGAVLSYIGVPGTGTSGTDTLVLSISDVYTYTLGTYLTQDLLPGSISIYSNHDLSGKLFRYVLIPGTILTTNSVLKGLTKEQLKKVDFATVSKALATSNTTTNN